MTSRAILGIVEFLNHQTPTDLLYCYSRRSFCGEPYRTVSVSTFREACSFAADSLAVMCGKPTQSGAPVVRDPTRTVHMEAARVLEEIFTHGLQPSWRLLYQGKNVYGSGDPLSVINIGEGVSGEFVAGEEVAHSDANAEYYAKCALGRDGTFKPLGVAVESAGVYASDIVEKLGLAEVERRLARSTVIIFKSCHWDRADLTRSTEWFRHWDGPTAPSFNFVPSERVVRAFVPQPLFVEVAAMLPKHFADLCVEVPMGKFKDRVFSGPDEIEQPDYVGVVGAFFKASRGNAIPSSYFCHATRFSS